MSAIRTADLTKRFNGVTAVDALNLSVEEGELFALLGVNGAGKTTTIKMLSCLISPTSGEAWVLGKSVLSAPFEVKRLINGSPQETAVAKNLSVRENLALIAGIHGANRRDAARKAAEAIDAYGLAPIADARAKTLSGGWQRRLSIAMALITDPKVLFLDEPTIGLDVLARRALWKVIQGLKGKTTVLLTTHYLEEAAHLSDRIGIMASGQLRAVGSQDELLAMTNTANLEEAFVAMAGAEGEDQ